MNAMRQGIGGDTRLRQMIIRGAVPADIGQIGVVGYASWRHGIGVFLPPEVCQRIGECTFELFAERALPEILIGEVAGRVAGLAATEGGDNTVSDLWVSPGVEGCGIGSALLAAVELRIGQRGYATAELEVLTMNRRALNLYGRRGYRPLWRRMRHDPYLQIDMHKTRLRKTLETLPSSEGVGPVT